MYVATKLVMFLVHTYVCLASYHIHFSYLAQLMNSGFLLIVYQYVYFVGHKHC